jgi:hypothetical protein
MSQVNVLISLLRSKWTGTAEAWGAGISSFHRRLADFRTKHITCKGYGNDIFFGYEVNGKLYKLQRMTMEIPTRWGKSKIVKYRLVAVK